MVLFAPIRRRAPSDAPNPTSNEAQFGGGISKPVNRFKSADTRVEATTKLRQAKEGRVKHGSTAGGRPTTSINIVTKRRFRQGAAARAFVPCCPTNFGGATTSVENLCPTLGVKMHASIRMYAMKPKLRGPSQTLGPPRRSCHGPLGRSCDPSHMGEQGRRRGSSVKLCAEAMAMTHASSERQESEMQDWFARGPN